MTIHDCAIVGGGMIGAATAVALADLGLKVALIEKFTPKALDSSVAKQPEPYLQSRLTMAFAGNLRKNYCHLLL